MEWQTEKLEGYLTITKDDAPGSVIHLQHFFIPASEATGPDARRNILRCAGCDYPDIRCVKHSIIYYVNSHIDPREQFCFRRPDFPDFDYDISLGNDYSASRIAYGSDFGYPSNFPAFLKRLEENRYDDLILSFCMPHELLPAINKATQIHYLTLFECYGRNGQATFQEIGRMKGLRGLCLRGLGGGVLDSAAVEELCKLTNLESLMAGVGFLVSIDAVRELGKLKNLRALHLELWGNCRIEHERRAVLVSALSSLRSLEKLEFLVLNTSPRLSPRELALPPNLKYLEINDHVFRLPVSQAKPRQTKNKPVSKKTKHDGEQSLFAKE